MIIRLFWNQQVNVLPGMSCAIMACLILARYPKSNLNASLILIIRDVSCVSNSKFKSQRRRITFETVNN